MSKKRGNGGQSAPEVDDYRFKSARRKNNPPAKIAADGAVPLVPRAKYQYNPHLPPVLRFDANGLPDKAADLLEKATRGRLDADEAEFLASLLRNQEPWLEWTGKREAKEFEVDPVALHIHERVSAQAILKVAARQDVERSLFADPQQAYHDAVQFYKHDIDWTNRLILGDSLSVMSSLAKREDLAGKVQMIYLDPPYGIKFASNFQPEIGRRDVKDKEQDLTREPEMVKAYRDTWNLGIHSYLSYLRDRLIAARELLADTGSIFVQIGEENLSRMTQVVTDVFGQENFCAQINLKKSSGLGGNLLPTVCDYLVWASKDKSKVRFRSLYRQKVGGDEAVGRYDFVRHDDGQTERTDETSDGSGVRFTVSDPTAQGFRPNTTVEYAFQGRKYHPGANRCWRTVTQGLERLRLSDRFIPTGSGISYVRTLDDHPVFQINNLWDDVGGIMSRSDPKRYVVQTSATIIERCVLMTTDPGDLVLDPTCGSGTTAYVAEQWGRRWITIDTSRVALSIARQRLLTAKFDYYKTKSAPGAPAGDSNGNPAKGFLYKTVPHITLKSIAQNAALDPIFAKHEPILEAKLRACNDALARVDKDLTHKLEAKLLKKQRDEGKKSITDADRRRWLLPPGNRDRSAEAKKRATVDLDAKQWYAWELPFDTDPDWPKALQDAVTEYRKAWRAKMDEVNKCIEDSAEQEELVDDPDVVKGVVRVSGPFTVEAVQPPEMSLGDVRVTQPAVDADGLGDLATFNVIPVEPGVGGSEDLAAYLDKMVRLLRGDGVTFPNNQHVKFTRLDATFQSGRSDVIHAEGAWAPSGAPAPATDTANTVAVTFGPQYGPVTAAQIVEGARVAFRRGYTDLVAAGFSFDAAAFDEAINYPDPRLKIHIATIRPDVNPAMDGLLKDRPGSQLFTVFGQPRTSVKGPDTDGQFTVAMEGVDIYNPVENSVVPSGADKVAAWFLDGDYDGQTFCITQAFFPDRGAWDKLARALNGKDGLIDAERFEALSGTVSLPFPAGKHKTAAVKVIDPRGNEVMSVHSLAKIREGR